jgi:hypothetical protein
MSRCHDVGKMCNPLPHCDAVLHEALICFVLLSYGLYI